MKKFISVVMISACSCGGSESKEEKRRFLSNLFLNCSIAEKTLQAGGKTKLESGFNN